MNIINLVVMKLRNFKGVQSFELNANGENTDVYGDNAVGKTTLFDAFTWVLFGKDSQDHKNFGIKTLDSNGNEIHHLEHEVEIGLDNNGQRVSLRRVYFENYKKVSGGSEKVFDGHRTKYYIDDVPTKEKDYKAYVDGLVSEEVFKLLTSPTYFNEVVKWEERRKVLIDVCGDVTDEEVIASNIDLQELPAMLEGKTIEQKKAQVTERKKLTKESIAQIPNRIDELRRLIPEVMLDVAKERERSEQIAKEVDTLRAQKVAVESGAAITNKQAELNSVENDINMHKRDFEQQANEGVLKLQVRMQEANANLSIAQSKAQQTKSELDAKHRFIEQTTQAKNNVAEQKAELVAKFRAIEAEQFVYSDDCTCPSCKQELPKEQLEQARETALGTFNTSRSTRLTEIKAHGTKLTESIKQYEEQITKSQYDFNQYLESFNAMQEDVKTHENTFAKVKQQLEKAKETVSNSPSVEADAKYIELSTKRDAIRNELNQLKTHAHEAVADIENEIAQLSAEKRSLDEYIAQSANVVATQRRIAELEDEQKVLAERYEQLEHITHLINEFERAKVKMLNDRINREFKLARFKLFNEQLNGGLKETCETTYDGVPYSDLNNAMKTNIGLDIIQTLQKHNGAKPVIFVDNRESITKLHDIDTQTVSLIVSEQDKQLRVVVNGKPQVLEQPTLFDEVV